MIRIPQSLSRLSFIDFSWLCFPRIVGASSCLCQYPKDNGKAQICSGIHGQVYFSRTYSSSYSVSPPREFLINQTTSYSYNFASFSLSDDYLPIRHSVLLPKLLQLNMQSAGVSLDGQNCKPCPAHLASHLMRFQAVREREPLLI